MADPTRDVGATIIDRRDKARKWMHDNVWGEVTEAFRYAKCRTKKNYIKDSQGKDTKQEDTSRTNVCPPEIAYLVRKKTARLCANPPKLRYIGGDNPLIAEAMTSINYQQFDRSGEMQQRRRMVHTGVLMGFSYDKVFWDNVEASRVFRKDPMQFRDRAAIMQSQGAPADQIDAAVQQLGPTLSDAEVAGLMNQQGDEIRIKQILQKYDGPVVKNIYPGDINFDPGVITLNDSDWVSEDFTETDLWLRKKLKQTYHDYESDADLPIFDAKAVQDLIDSDPEIQRDVKADDLRRMMYSELNWSDPNSQQYYEKRLLVNKRFAFVECHEMDENGRMGIYWIAEVGGGGKGICLNSKDPATGKPKAMPYPYDFMGKTNYTEFVPLPDVLTAFGDSSPRLLRYLQRLHAATLGQNNDVIANASRHMILMRRGEDPPEVIRKGLLDILMVRDPSAYSPWEMPSIPAGAFERDAQIRSLMASAEPALNSVETGTAMNPQAGRTATTALIQSKSSDVMFQYEMDALSIHDKELGEKKLWLNQALASEPWMVNGDYPMGDKLSAAMKNAQGITPLGPTSQGYQPPKMGALTERYGKTAAFCVDPLEIQEDYRVEPEASSMLSVDDDFHQDRVMKLGSLAAQFPGIIDPKKVVMAALATIRGIGNPDDWILPEQGPQMPPAKVSINVNFPMDKEPSDIVNQLLPLIGLQPSQELQHRDTLDAVGRMNTAATAAHELAQPPQDPDELKGKPEPKPKQESAS